MKSYFPQLQMYQEKACSKHENETPCLLTFHLSWPWILCGSCIAAMYFSRTANMRSKAHVLGHNSVTPFQQMHDVTRWKNSMCNASQGQLFSYACGESQRFLCGWWRLRKITTLTVWTCDIPSITMWLNLTWSVTFSCHSTGAEVLLIYTCSYCKYKAVYVYLLQLNRFRHFV